MPSLAAPRPAAAFFPALRRPRSLLPAPSFPLVRAQEPPRLHLPLVKNPCLGFSASTSPAERRRRRKTGAAAAPHDLEAEIYEFMLHSAKPTDFPTKEELLAAGRVDLVDAIATQGGWLAFGWNLDDEARSNPAPAPALAPVPVGIGDDSAGPAYSLASSSSSGTMEMEGSGIEGILSRLEKERSWSYAEGLEEKEVNGRYSWKNDEYDPGDEVGVFERSRGSISSDLGEDVLDDFEGIHCCNGTSADVNGIISSMPDMWRIWSRQRAGSPTTEFEAAEISPNEGRRQLEQNLMPEVSMDSKMHKIAHSESDTDNKNVPHTVDEDSCQNQIRLHLHRLESELKSALKLIRSRSNDVTSHKGQESSLKELHRLSDALEFQETEIMNARDKLRSTRAKLAVLEGKMAFEIIEAQKIIEEKQKGVDAAQKSLRLLRTACIVWPNSASEVLLTGSFDGWTSKRKMERSSTGIFSLFLKLYPGRYEFKFIVDGVWMVDPLRPIVRNNGHENNLLIIL